MRPSVAIGRCLNSYGRPISENYLDLVDYFLDVRHALGEHHGFFLLRRRLHAALQHQRSILRVVRNALVVEILIRLERRLVVVLDRAIEVGINRLELALRAHGTDADLVRNGIVRGCLFG